MMALPRFLVLDSDSGRAFAAAAGTGMIERFTDCRYPLTYLLVQP
jgi:hypothetical protein